jgi:hypothetical protein
MQCVHVLTIAAKCQRPIISSSNRLPNNQQREYNDHRNFGTHPGTIIRLLRQKIFPKNRPNAREPNAETNRVHPQFQTHTQRHKTFEFQNWTGKQITFVVYDEFPKRE